MMLSVKKHLESSLLQRAPMPPISEGRACLVVMAGGGWGSSRPIFWNGHAGRPVSEGRARLAAMVGRGRGPSKPIF